MSNDLASFKFRASFVWGTDLQHEGQSGLQPFRARLSAAGPSFGRSHFKMPLGMRLAASANISTARFTGCSSGLTLCNTPSHRLFRLCKYRRPFLTAEWVRPSSLLALSRSRAMPHFLAWSA